MRRWAKRLAAGLLALALLLAAAVALFLDRPGVLLTSRTVGVALRYFGSAYTPRWSAFEFSAAATGPRRHRYALRAADFCAGTEFAEACFARFELSVVVRYSRRGARVELIETLVAEGGAVSVDRTRQGKAGQGGLASLALLTMPVRSARVGISEFELRAKKYRLKGKVSAALTPGARRPLVLEADLSALAAGKTRRLKAALTADAGLFQGSPPSQLDALATAELRGYGRARVELRARRAGDRYEGSGQAELALSTGPVRAARFKECRGSGGASSGELSCRFEVVPAASLGEIKSANGRLHARARVRGGHLSASAEAELDPVTAWYEVTGRLAATVEGRVDRPLADLALRHDARLRFRASFEKIVAVLRETRYAVPAPVHVLAGPVVLILESRGDPRASRQSVRYELTTDLAGVRQRLAVLASGVLTTTAAKGKQRSFDHGGELLLKEVALELPRLEVGPAPKIAIDRRIATAFSPNLAVSTAPAAAPPPFPLRSRLAIRTEKPALLFSNLAKDPVPVALDLVATHSPAAVSGVVGIRSFGVELFRRSATVDHLKVTVSSFSRIAALEGLVVYRAARAVINIAILGTTARPRVELSSVPPLKREDIIGLLVFGKNPDELDPDQTASVANTETALESRAFGLASLYLFGSTPIEHVGYDSASKTASVKVRLPGGANLTIGSDFDQSRQLSLRKPLAPHWAIQSEITEQGPQSRAAMTFLEWFNRY